MIEASDIWTNREDIELDFWLGEYESRTKVKETFPKGSLFLKRKSLSGEWLFLGLLRHRCDRFPSIAWGWDTEKVSAGWNRSQFPEEIWLLLRECHAPVMMPAFADGSGADTNQLLDHRFLETLELEWNPYSQWEEEMMNDALEAERNKQEIARHEMGSDYNGGM